MARRPPGRALPLAPALALALLLLLLHAVPAARAQETCATHSFAPFADAGSPSDVCGGRGTCEEGRCQCDAGWTGRSDIVDLDGLDCHINELAISLLWVASIFINVVVLFTSAPRLRLRYSRFLKRRAEMRKLGKHFGLFSNRGVAACVGFFCVGQPACVLYAFLRILKPDERLGSSLASTLLFAVARSTFYGACYAFQPALLATLLSGNSSAARLVIVADRVTLGVSVFAILLSWTPFFVLTAGTKTASVNLAVWYSITAGTMLHTVAFGLQAAYLKYKVCKVLDKSYARVSSPKILDTRNAIVAMQGHIMMQCAFQSIIYLLFASVPALLGHHDYFLPLGWVAYSIIGKRLAFTQVIDRDHASAPASFRTSNLWTPDPSDDGAGAPKYALEDPVASSLAAASTRGVPRGTELSPPSLAGTTSLDQDL